jgi:hypothetical protein
MIALIVDQAVTSRPEEPVEAKFRAAWHVFAQTCGQYLAPEPTYRAWFTHYPISQFGIDRVAREPVIKHRHFASPWQKHLSGAHVRLDAVVTRWPGVQLAHYTNSVVPASDGTGLHLMADLAVISELKLSATQARDWIIPRSSGCLQAVDVPRRV